MGPRLTSRAVKSSEPMALPMVGCPSGTLTVTQHQCRRHEEDAASASENNARSYGRQDSNIEVFDYDARADVRMRVAFVGLQDFVNY
jgi:hypothetical protein